MLERNVISATSRKKRTAPRILCYHSVGTSEWGVNDVAPNQFRKHLEVACDAGFRFVEARTIAMGAGRPGDLALTFDDGMASVAVNAAPALSELGIPWTLFVVTGWADGAGPWTDLTLDWSQLEKLANQGATLGSHSVTHPDFGTLDPRLAQEELGASKEELRRRLGIETDSFAIPFGQRRNWNELAMASAKAVGYEHIFAQSVDRRPAGTVARTFITKFDRETLFRSALSGAFDSWDEWM